MPTITPRQPAPALEFDTLGGERWRLADQRPDTFTMVVFYRGRHCPVCQTYLRELDGMVDDFRARGVEPVAVSGDERERAEGARDDWPLEHLTVGFGLPVDAMRAWGLFVSSALNDDEPSCFGEPGLFLVGPDGSVFYVAVNSMAFGRPALEEMLGAVDFVTDKGYPPRGVA